MAHNFSSDNVNDVLHRAFEDWLNCTKEDIRNKEVSDLKKAIIEAIRKYRNV